MQTIPMNEKCLEIQTSCTAAYFEMDKHNHLVLIAIEHTGTNSHKCTYTFNKAHLGGLYPIGATNIIVMRNA